MKKIYVVTDITSGEPICPAHEYEVTARYNLLDYLESFITPVEWEEEALNAGYTSVNSFKEAIIRTNEYDEYFDLLLSEIVLLP